MKNLCKPASFLLYILSLVCFFFVGMFMAKYSGAGENQGLAGGAIVFFYGLVTAVIAFVVSLITAYRAELKLIINLNKVLAIILLFLSAVLYFQVKALEKERGDNKEIVLPPKTAVPE